MKRKPTYDQRCYDLVAIFLGDEPEVHTPENIDELASAIQSTIEEHIYYLKRERKANSQFGVGA